MRTVLITGATGCLGSCLALSLSRRGDRLKIIRRPTSDVAILGGIPREDFIGDICDEELLLRAAEGCDIVFHTAALVSFARHRRDEQHRVNVLGTRTVVNACRRAGVPALVHASSVSAIGLPPPGEPANEETPIDRARASGYKLTKLLAEEEIRAGVDRGQRAVIVNPSVIIGERDTRFHGGALIRDIKRGRIPFYIDGGMNIVYVGDVAEGMLSAAERGRTGERYILGGEDMTHREIFIRTAALIDGRRPLGRLPLPVLRGAGRAVEAVSGLLGVTPLLTADLADVAGRYNWFTSDKARRELGYSSTPFDQTILAAYRWYRENGYL